MPEIAELNIGHFLIGEAIFVGLSQSVRRMRAPMDEARLSGRCDGEMIVGIGSDLIDIRRVEKTLERYGERFIARVFTDMERRKSEGRRTRAASYAKRFAAKEACAKALGTGLRHGVFWRDMGVVNLRSGKPTMALTGGAAERLSEMMPAGNVAGHPRHHHRRFPARPGVRDHRGRAEWRAWRRKGAVMGAHPRPAIAAAGAGR